MSKVTFFNDENTCICLCGLKFPKEKDDDDCSNHLKNWELWIEKRKKIHKKLGKLGREPGELLMNAAEEYRSVKEDKLVLGYTNIKTDFDKFRGNPKFWKLPYSLGYHDSTEYFAVKTKEDKNEIPSIEYVGTPNYILQEKGVVPRTRNLYTRWKNNNDYRREVMQRMASKILKIEPHKPDLQDFILIGEKIKLDLSKEIPSLPESKAKKSLSISTAEIISVVNVEERATDRVSLKLNNITFNKDVYSSSPNKISVMFEYFMDKRVPCQKSLLFENTGKVVLRLYWNEYTRLKIFREYCTDTRMFYPFKFNRNEILLLPGQKLDLSVEFKTIRPGNYVESWELTTLPKIWSEDYHLVIVFKGFSFMKNFDKKADVLIKELNQRVRNTVIKDLLSDVIEKGTYCKETAETHSYDFSEKELFEGVNLKDNVCQRTSKYVYNKQLITELNELYQEMKQLNDDKIWNLSIKKLKVLARERDLLIYLENNITTYDTARMKRMLLKENNVIETQTTKEQPDKQAAGKSIVKTSRKDIPQSIIETEAAAQRGSYYNILKDIIQKLEKPSIRENFERRKYLFSYTIIRTYLFKMFDHLYLLDEERNSSDKNGKEKDLLDEEANTDESEDQVNEDIVTNKPKHIQYLQDRLFYEIFDEGYVSRTKRIPSEAACSYAKPKSSLLRDISLSDTRRICKVYFNKEETHEKGQKKTRIEDSAARKTVAPKKVENTRNQNMTEKDLLVNVDEDYNPFIEEHPGLFENGDKSRKPLDLTIKTAKEIENYEEKYIFVYKSLCNAIDDLVETTESFKDQSLPIGTLNELRKCFNLSVKSNVDSEMQSKSSIGIEESVPENRQSGIQNQYYQFLLETHWENNMKTKKYFVREKKSSMKNEECKIQIPVKVPSNIFSIESYQRKPPSPGKTNIETQTMDIVSKFNIEKGSISSQRASVAETSSRNIFYFLDNWEQEDE